MSVPDIAQYSADPYAVSATAQGKVNLYLSVGGTRADGYHELETVFHALDVTETVTVGIAETVGTTNTAGTTDTAGEAGMVTLARVTGRDAGRVPTGEAATENLAVRGAAAVVARYRELTPDVVLPRFEVSIEKGVPVAGGMAGGAADAAAALVATAELLHGPRAAEIGLGQAPAPGTTELYEMAAQLGSDVPFCLQGGTALGRAAGDDLVPVMVRGRYHWALVMDTRGLSTAEVFARLDDQRNSSERGERPDVRASDPEDIQRALLSGDPEMLGEQLRFPVNDLQAPAISLSPDLRRTLAAGRDAGALACLVSGSGPTVAMLCRDHDHAVDVATTLAAEGVGGRAVSTATATSSPHGARLVP